MQNSTREAREIYHKFDGSGEESCTSYCRSRQGEGTKHCTGDGVDVVEGEDEADGSGPSRGVS